MQGYLEVIDRRSIVTGNKSALFCEIRSTVATPLCAMGPRWCRALGAERARGPLGLLMPGPAIVTGESGVPFNVEKLICVLKIITEFVLPL